MSLPTPAIVPQEAVRRLPRRALLVLCASYVLLGFLWRDPWRSEDISAFGLMWDMARGATAWVGSQPFGQGSQTHGLLSHWLGAWSIQGLQRTHIDVADHFAVRIPFVILLVSVLVATWYAVYGLARSPLAQPVSFAFGGEAQPRDYACAMADGGLLALLACLGLALLAHESSAALAQLGFTSLSFFAVTFTVRQKPWAAPLAMLTLCALAASGAPAIALLLAWGSIAVLKQHNHPSSRIAPVIWLMGGGLTCCGVATLLGLPWGQWQWPHWDWRSAAAYGRLLVWFGWPATPLAAWTLWRWRHQWRSPHMALPMLFLVIPCAAAAITPAPERSLLLALPALASLAAFALPTLSRAVRALIDWFTLLFFSGWALVMWAVWLSLHTGFPTKPAANIARLAPGYVAEFSLTKALLGLAATLAWVALVRWRVGRHRAALWKSLVLPAGGACLGWVLMMTLLLGPLNYALGNVQLVNQIKTHWVAQAQASGLNCAESQGVSPGMVAALRYHGRADIRPVLLPVASACPWLIASTLGPKPTVAELSDDAQDAQDEQSTTPIQNAQGVDPLRWIAVSPSLRGPRGGETLMLYRRMP